MEIMLIISQWGLYMIMLIFLGFLITMIYQAIGNAFEYYNLGRGVKIAATLLIVVGIFLIVLLDATKVNLPENRARAVARQQEELKQLSAPVNIQPWGCYPGGRCDEKRSEAVALADSESIPEIGLNRVLVKRDSDEKQFAIVLSSTRNVKKGEKVQVVTASYWISANRIETLIIGK